MDQDLDLSGYGTASENDESILGLAERIFILGPLSRHVYSKFAPLGYNQFKSLSVS